MRRGIAMGSQGQSKRSSKRRIVEENQSPGKEILEIDLNNAPHDVSEMPDFLYCPPDTASSVHPQSVVPLEGPHDNAMAPIFVDDNDDEVVFLSEHQANRNESETNWNGRAGIMSGNAEVIHIDPESHSSSAVEEPAAILTSLSLGIRFIDRFMPESHIFSVDSYEDSENNHYPKRMKAGSSREPQVESCQDDDEPVQAVQPAFKCAVCLGAIVDETTTSCGHLFCQGCIKIAIKAQKKCPTCRKKLSMRNIHRIYFPGST